MPSPAVAEHGVKFYADDATLISTVSKFLAGGLREGDAAIVVTTAAHRDLLRARLEADGVRAKCLVQVVRAGDRSKLDELAGGRFHPVC